MARIKDERKGAGCAAPFLVFLQKSIDKCKKYEYNIPVKTSRMYPFSPYARSDVVDIVQNRF